MALEVHINGTILAHQLCLVRLSPNSLHILFKPSKALGGECFNPDFTDGEFEVQRRDKSFRLLPQGK